MGLHGRVVCLVESRKTGVILASSGDHSHYDYGGEWEGQEAHSIDSSRILESQAALGSPATHGKQKGL